MSSDWLALGLSLNAVGWVAASYQGSRAREARGARAAWRWLAAGGALLELGLAGSLLGWLEGIAIVLCAWMLLGLVFAASVAARPTRTLRAAAVLGTLGGLLVLGGAVATWF